LRYVIGSDHAGLALKNQVVEQLRARGIEVEDLGTHTTSSVDYPDLAGEVARTVARGDAQFGILICGSGIGVSIAANKVRGIRAAVCRTEYEARMARLHNDANVLCMGERVTGGGLAEVVVEAWLSTEFEGGRHQRRVDKIAEIERENVS
jgi:ribose 5-phosphate isomerase B